jgi:hypothetical protein
LRSSIKTLAMLCVVAVVSSPMLCINLMAVYGVEYGFTKIADESLQGHLRWTPFFVPENGLYLLRVRESLVAALPCLRLPRGGGETLPKLRHSPPPFLRRNLAS